MTAELLEWFAANKRDLPWRRERSPYKVWLSEVMLQQTQVTTVIPYFERWLEIFPDVFALAEASLDDVLKLWEGLGYYRRARNLHRAAQVVAFEREGIFPTTYEAWLELPGVGAYTAAAIASIMSGDGVVAVDGNVKRVAARINDFRAGQDRCNKPGIEEILGLLVDKIRFLKRPVQFR